MPHIKVHVASKVQPHSAFKRPSDELPQVDCFVITPEPIQQPIGAVCDNDDLIFRPHSLLSDSSKVSILQHVYVVNKGKVNSKKPPVVGKVQREVTSLLRQEPASQPALVNDMALEGFKAVNPVAKQKTNRYSQL